VYGGISFINNSIYVHAGDFKIGLVTEIATWNENFKNMEIINQQTDIIRVSSWMGNGILEYPLGVIKRGNGNILKSGTIAAYQTDHDFYTIGNTGWIDGINFSIPIGNFITHWSDVCKRHKDVIFEYVI